MAKAKALTPAQRIAAIKEADVAARNERAQLDHSTLTELLAAARDALPAVERLEAACGDLVSDLTTGALKAQGSNMSERLRNIITVAEADLTKVAETISQEA